MKMWRGTGIIARIESKKIAKSIATAQVPVIGLDIAPDLLSGFRRQVWLSEVHSDPKLTAKLAAEHPEIVAKVRTILVEARSDADQWPWSNKLEVMKHGKRGT